MWSPVCMGVRLHPNHILLAMGLLYCTAGFGCSAWRQSPPCALTTGMHLMRHPSGFAVSAFQTFMLIKDGFPATVDLPCISATVISFCQGTHCSFDTSLKSVGGNCPRFPRQKCFPLHLLHKICMKTPRNGLTVWVKLHAK